MTAPAKPDRWADGSFRAMWEKADPKVNFATIAAAAGVSKQAVAKRAKREGWTRPNVKKLRMAIHERAEDKANTRSVKGEVLPEEPPLPEGFPGLPSVLGTAAAIEIRAALIDRHRREWNQSRSQLYAALEGEDFDKAKLAKISAETFSIIQSGERKAWGLDGDAILYVRVIESRRDRCD